MTGNNTTFAASVAALDSFGGDNGSSDGMDPAVESQPQYPPMTQDCLLYSFIIYTIVVGLLCILGLLGNIMAFVVFWQDKIKTSTSFLFQGLSMIDSLLLIGVFPMYCIRPFVDYTKWLQVYSVAEPYVLVYILPCAFTLQTATVWVTVLVAVNRYIAVCKPYQASRLCTVAQAKKQMGIVILFTILYNIPRFAEARLVTDIVNNQTTVRPEYTALGDAKWYWIIYGNIFYLVFLLILPLLILTILNVRLINALNELKRKRKEMQTARQQQDNNVTFVLIIVVLVFTVCQAPALVNQILWNALTDEARACKGFQFYFQRISNLLVTVNSAANFLIYFLFNTRFRQVLMQNVCKMEYKSLKPTTSNHKDTEGTNETLL